MKRATNIEKILASLLTLLIVILYISSCAPKAKFGGQRFGEPPPQQGQISNDDRHQKN